MKLLNGLNTDVASVDQPAGTYRRSRNMILDDLAGALATEKAPLLYPNQINDSGDFYNRFENQEVCGRFDVPGDRTIFGIKARATTLSSFPLTEYTEQIVEVQEDGSVTTLVQDGFGNLQFDATNPFQGVGYVNGAGELILVWSNGVHKPLYLNADTHSNNQDEPLLVFPEADFPMVRPIYNGSNDQAGNIYGGTYTFVMAYEVIDGTDNLTQYGPGVGSFQIGNGNTDENKKFRTSAKMKFYGLDTRYNYARIYAVRNWQGTETVTYADRISITGADVDWAYIGQEIETTSVIADELYIPSISYNSAGTIAVSDDRLFMANLKSDVITFEEGQAIANNIDVFWTADEAGLSSAQYDNIQLFGTAGVSRAINYPSEDFRDCYPNRGETENGHPDDTPGEVYTDHGGMLGGFMPNEVYALYVSFLMKDGQWSRAFHIPAGGDSGDFTSTARDGAASLAATAANIKTTGTFNQLLGGKTGYNENTTDSYPNVGTFFDVGLSNDPVRHHLMPSPKQLWQSTQTSQGGDDSLNSTDYSGEWCGQQCGLFFDNVVIGNDTADKIQGFRVFYAKATTDKRRVKAYAPAWRYTYDFTGNQKMRIYDPLLLSEKPSVDGWAVTEVYKKMSYLEQLSYVMASSDVDTFGYMPANTTNDDFDNEYRETALCLKLGEELTTANDWHVGYPGFFGGFNIQYATNSSEQYHGWDSQIVHDLEVFEFPERTSGAGLIGDNFVSIFGTFMKTGPATTEFAYDARPTKNDTTYPVVYGQGGHAGTQYNALTAASTGGSGNLTGGAYMGFGGNGGSFVMLSRDYDDYYLNYEGQELVDTHDIVRVDGGATYKSNQVVRGGDTFIAPVVVEFLDHQQSNDPQPEAANASTDFRFIHKTSYFTWTRVRPGKNDLDGTLNWTDLVGYSDATSTPFNGETFNTYNLGPQWFKLNDGKSAFPSVSDSLDVSDYPNRIIRSAKQGYESTKFQWGEFLPADYYDNALAKESIRNLEDYQGELIIHHGNALYKTRSKFNFDASGASVFVGTGDIFQAPPQELFPDNAGYAGVTHWSDTLLCRAGYIWVDRAGKRIFKLGQGMEELSAKGIRNYLRDTFLPLDTSGMVPASNTEPTIFSAGQGGFALGYDPYNERILVTKRYCTSNDANTLTVDGETLSYSLRHQCWASMHDYAPMQYFQTYNKLWAFNEVDNLGDVDMNDGSNNLAGIFETSGTAPGSKYNQGGALDTDKDSCYVDAVFNMGGPVSKVWQNFNWRTRAGEGEGTSTKNETFEQVRVYNDYQVSNANTDFRMTDDRWQFNRFRDYSVNTAPGWFEADGTTFKADAVILNNTKSWYNTPRFVSDYAIIRLETLNTTGNRLYLLDVSATARRAYR